VARFFIDRENPLKSGLNSKLTEGWDLTEFLEIKNTKKWLKINPG
jgi:hypothetical protein